MFPDAARRPARHTFAERCEDASVRKRILVDNPADLFGLLKYAEVQTGKATLELVIWRNAWLSRARNLCFICRIH